MSFLQANLRTRVNYFSVIDQNNQINCLLYFHSCLTFEFSHSTVMIPYQNSSSQCMNFRKRGLVWKSVAILFSLECKNHPVLEIQTQQCDELNWIIKKIILYICFAGLISKTSTGCENYSLISMIYIRFSAKRQLLLLLLPTMSATSPSNYDIKMFEMK